MELITKELFSQLEWYTINIYIKGKPSFNLKTRILKKEYYETLHYIVKPFIGENKNWIKCFYYTWYWEENKNTPYHVVLRIGAEKDLNEVVYEVDKFFNKLTPDKRELLDDKTYNVLEIKDHTHDKNRFAGIEEGKFNESAYYWFVMHWMTGSIYFLEILENGYDNFPELSAIPHLQWNLMGSIVTHPDGKFLIAPETQTLFDSRTNKGVVSIQNFGEIPIDIKIKK